MIQGTVTSKTETERVTRTIRTRVLTEAEILEVLREYFILGDESSVELRYDGPDHGSIPIVARIDSRL